MKPILVTGAFRASLAQLGQLADDGYEVIWMQDEKAPLPPGAESAVAVVCNGLFLHHSLDEFPSLRLIQLTSAGLDRVPVEDIRARGITLCNARGVYSSPMAEWALCSAMMHFQHRRELEFAARERRWEKQRDVREISRMEVAVVGAGSIGSSVARLFSALGASVSGFDIVAEQREPFVTIYDVKSLKAMAGRFDIIILTAPLLPSTRGMIDGAVLDAMKPGALLINIARGGLINENDLIDRLIRRPDSLFAALDVTEIEPTPDSSPLWTLPNVMLTPHNSFVGDGNADRLFGVIRRNLSAI